MTGFSIALVPVVVLILIGYGTKRARFLTDDVWAGIEKLTYFILFPALLIRTLGNQTISQVPWPSMLIVIGLTLLLSAAILVTMHLFYPQSEGPEFTSVFQGGVRFNTYITLAVAQSLFGSEGLAQGSVVVGFMVVMINLLCVSVFTIWGRAKFQGVIGFIRVVIGNPLIVACAIGWTLSLSGVGLPPVIEKIFEIPGRAALPLGLLAVGAALKPELIHGHSRSIAVSTVVQFLVKPLLAAMTVFLTGLSGVTAGVLFIALITPTAPSSYILAKQLGGDTEVMASIITFQTLLAFAVMPLLAFFLLR